MKILLVDVDSKIPNLALMKVSTYYKSQGHEVKFNVTEPDLVYASVIFKKNRHLTDGLRFLYPNAEIDIGGSGYDLKKTLPKEIEECSPDYTLYPDNDRYMGFTTRGCIRSCPFCIVRRKEGMFHRIYETPQQAIDSIVGESERFNMIELFDNNILSDKEWFFGITDEIIRRNYKVDFNQGLDIRLLDEEIAKRLVEMKPIVDYKFAFDSMSYKDHVLKGIEILKNAGLNVRQKVLFYVYCDSDDQYDDAVERCRILKEHGATAYIMLNLDVKHTKRMKQLKRWTRPQIFWSIDISEYDLSVIA